MTDTVFAFPAGKMVSNRATLGAVATFSFTVPAGKRWVVLGYGSFERDVNADFKLEIKDSGGNAVFTTDSVVAGVSMVYLPTTFAASTYTSNIFKGLVLDAGWNITATWGVAQTTPVVALPVLEIDV